MHHRSSLSHLTRACGETAEFAHFVDSCLLNKTTICLKRAQKPTQIGLSLATTGQVRQAASRISPWLAGSTLLFAGFLQAAPGPDWVEFNAGVLTEHIQPRYQRLAQRSQTLAETATLWCQARDAKTFPALQRAFDDSLQAWQGIQHVQFGPVQLLMRNYAIEFWPDRKGITDRQLQEALNGPSSAHYDAEFFRHASVSIKGYPALERLLYGDDALSQLQQHPGACALASAISVQLVQISEALSREWQTALPDMPGGADEEASGHLPALSLELLRTLVEPVELIRDSKLQRVLGADQVASRLHRAENWRSGQSLTSIATNLAALEDLYAARELSLDRILREQGAAELADQITALFAQARAEIRAVPGPLATALADVDSYTRLRALTTALADVDSYTRLRALTTTLQSLDDALNNAMPAIDVQLGFNSRDGD